MSKIINKNLLILILISFTFFIGKWLISFIYFAQEDLTLKIIHDSHQDSAMYFHYVKSFADFNFKENFNSLISQNKLLVYPIGSIIFHSILYKFIGITSFVIFELISIFIFLFVFYLIFKQFKISNLNSIFFASTMFVLPIIIEQINFLEVVEVNTFVQNFYNLRFPRPLISQLYFFIFIFISIISYRDDMLKLKYLLPLSLIMSLTLSSFFFIFFTQIFSYIFLLLIKYKKNFFKEILKNYKNIIISLVVFIILITPFFIFLIGTSDGYSSRMGIFSISFDDKLFLINYYIEKLTRIKILFLYAIIFFVFYFHSKFIKKNHDIIKIFLIIFVSSILSPIIFILISNKISFLYHFNNMVVISSFLFLIIFFISLSTYLSFKINIFNINKNFSLIGILILILFYNFDLGSKTLNEIKQNESRKEINEIILKIKHNNNLKIKESNILTFSNLTLIWSILNDVKDLKIVDGTFSAKDDTLTEIDLIEALKFLKLNKFDFESFISNKKVGYRYLNENARQIFWQKYQANSLFSFKNSNDFNINVKNFVENSSPFYSHQFAIPRFEQKRLIEMFVSTKKNNNYAPDIIIIEKKKNIINKSIIDLNFYCKSYNGNHFKLFFLKKYFD